MASGLPVLVSNRCGCVYDLVEEGKNGFTFNPYDTIEMTTLLVSITNNKYDIENMGQASRDTINLWTPDTFAINLRNAVKVAFEVPKKKFGYFDRLLLYTLSRWP